MFLLLSLIPFNVPLVLLEEVVRVGIFNRDVSGGHALLQNQALVEDVRGRDKERDGDDDSQESLSLRVEFVGQE